MQLPARVGKYELVELLGGGMSRVYRARDTVIGRTVAVKLLTGEACRDDESKKRFLREAQVAGSVAHDNIVTVYDFGVQDGRPYMVTEFLRGEDLRTMIKAGRVGDIDSRLKIALQIARALDHIHSLKIIHRDIKPENIHVTAAGLVKLMDFGIARDENSQLTRPGFTLGTPYYMAPEQVRGQTITHQVDIYAFGVLLFELMTGARPIESDTIEKIFFQILYQPLDLAPLEKASVPAPIAGLVARLTAKAPADRPQTFGAVIATLEDIQRGIAAPGVPPATAAPPTRVRPAMPPPPPTAFVAPARRLALPADVGVWVFVVAGAGLLMMIAAGILFFGR
jgi:eukaryotic-like serine/threonine-protein kinase